MRHFTLLLLSLLLIVETTGAASADTPMPQFSRAEIQDLAAPIALYPDPLIGLILPASVFPDQIVDAALLIRTKEDAKLIAEQDWDASVKGVATYPGVLKMMYEKLDWATKLGDVFLNQSDELRDVIQTLRLKAQNVGNLRTTEEQQVATKMVNGVSVVTIEPTKPEVVYVPQYSTQVVYTEPAKDDSNYLVPLATFGLGMALGAAMSDDHHDDNVYVYGGYPGRVAWHDNGSVDHWADNRQDMIRDSQNHRQDVQKDRINYRQDTNEDRRNFRQDQIESGNYKNGNYKNTAQQRQEFNQQQSAKRQDYASQTQANRQNRPNTAGANAGNYEAKKQQAQQRSQEWKSTAADRGVSNSPSRASAANSSQSRSNAFQSSSSRPATSAYSTRGASSRSAGGYSRGSNGMSRGGARRR